MAQDSKQKGNELFNAKDRQGAIHAYTDAVDRLMNALRSDPNREKNTEVGKLLAVCLANRAAAYLLPREDAHQDTDDLHMAWKDGEIAIRADPSYAKG